MENYELGKILGQGTYGVCHLATDLRDGQLYAVKRISLRNHKDTIAAQKEAEVRASTPHHRRNGVRLLKKLPGHGLDGSAEGAFSPWWAWAPPTGRQQVLSRLKHPNVVEFKESFSDDESTLCIVVAYCEASPANPDPTKWLGPPSFGWRRL